MMKGAPCVSRGVGLALMILVVNVSVLHAQEAQRLWLSLSEDALVSPTGMHPSDLGITPRALWRRTKVLPYNQLIDAHDLPISPSVLEQIRSTGARIRTVSRWLRAVSVEASITEAAAIRSLPVVTRVSTVKTFHRPIAQPQRIEPMVPLDKRSWASGLDYGSSFTQLDLINVIPLHDAGLNAGGIIVGMVDDGYNNHRIHEATAGNRVLAEYDFIQNDGNTSYETGEYPGQGNHGMYTYSSLSGFRPGSLIGPAYGSSYLLAKTEVIGSETQIEEDLYVQGLEWLEQQGADVVSSSLGYIDWYTYTDLDGNTAVTTKAALIAMRKGVLLVTAMGNEGWYQMGVPGVTGTMIAPADADSVISVGAVSSTRALAGFSSTGPTADGRIKPEVVAQGVSVVCASPVTTNGYVAVSGTSLSTPLTAGVAALILSAHPWLTPAEVREAMIATAVHVDDGTSKSVSYPNNFYGYGLVDALEAVLYHGPAFSSTPLVVERETSLDVYTTILSKTPLNPDSVLVWYQGRPGGAFQQLTMNPTANPGQFMATIPRSSDAGYPRGYISAFSPGVGTRRSPFNAPDSLFTFSQDQDTGGAGPVVSSFNLLQNYPNPFNAGTTIAFDAPYDGPTHLSVYNLLGQRVVALFTGEAVQGRNNFFWDARDDAGIRVPSGVYIYQLISPQGVQSRRMMILK